MKAASVATANPQGDLDIAQRIARGDEAAFVLLMRRHNRMLYRATRAIVKNDADAEDALQEAFRVVFMLRAVEEMSVEETAQALDIPEATVRTRFFRARGLLRESLAREVDTAIDEAFAFAGGRCDRIVAGVLARLQNEMPPDT